MGIKVGGIHRAVLHVENLTCFLADNDLTHPAGNERFDFSGAEIDCRESFSRRNHHLVAACGVWILVEVQAGRPALLRQSDDSMAADRIHPFLRRRFSECNGCSQDDPEQHAVGAVCDRPCSLTRGKTGAHRAPPQFAYCSSIAAYRCAASSHEGNGQGTNFFNWMLVAM